MYISITAILMLLFGMAGAQDDVAQQIRQAELEIKALKRETSKLSKEIARTDSLRTEETARARELTKNYERDVQRRQVEITELKERMQEVQKKIHKEQAAQAGYQNRIDESKALAKVLREALVEACKALESEIGGLLPWETAARQERVRVLKRDLEAGTASLEEGFSRLNALYNAEIASGDEVALLEKPLTRLDGETINAQILKIGNQWLLYADEEGKKFGILQQVQSPGGKAFQWEENLNFAARNAIRKALEVKMAKQPPTLVSLPLTVYPREQVKKGGEHAE